jgi:hypothetical protein
MGRPQRQSVGNSYGGDDDSGLRCAVAVHGDLACEATISEDARRRQQWCRGAAEVFAEVIGVKGAAIGVLADDDPDHTCPRSRVICARAHS